MKKPVMLIMTKLYNYEKTCTHESRLERKAEKMNSCDKVVRLRCGVFKDSTLEMGPRATPRPAHSHPGHVSQVLNH